MLLLAGPTASGKSAAALRLAAELGGEIVCADPYQSYAGLPIISAQPSKEDAGSVPHHLYGTVALYEQMDAARLAGMVEDCVAAIHGRGALPIVVGGSGLYLQAITHGLDDLPRGDAALRERLAGLSAEELAERLLALDPAVVGTGLNLRNPRHVTRALEICLLTGRPATELKQRFARPPREGLVAVWLAPEREVLHERIHARAEAMAAMGAVEEAAAAWPSASATAVKTLGLKEFYAVAAGSFSLEDACESVRCLTRQYAKRQMSWLRGQAWMEPVTSQEEMTLKINKALSKS